MGNVVLLAFAAALNPTLLAMSTIMLLAPEPKRLFLGYLLGAMLTSMTLGLVIVFAFADSSGTSTAQRTLSPALEAALGIILLVVAIVLGTDRDRGFQEKRQARKEAKGPKKPSRTEELLARGSARITFAVGAALTLPGASYLAGLHEIADLGYSNAGIVLTVLGFNVIMLTLLELPLLGYVVAPEWTPTAVQRCKDWVGRNARALAVRGAATIGTLLLLEAAISALSA